MARVGRNASCGLPPHWFPRPRAEKRDNGRSMVAQLSRPWSNSSPWGGGEREGGKKGNGEEEGKEGEGWGGEGKGGMGWEGEGRGGEGRGGEGKEGKVHVCLYNCLDPQVSTTAGYGGGKRERKRREGEGEVVPNGVLIPVLLACFPSMPSSVCERKWEIAQNSHTHAGIGG